MYLHYFAGLVLFFISCSNPESMGNGEEEGQDTTNYRQEMRQFVQNLSTYAKGENPAFLVVPQNGIELVTDSGHPTGKRENAYLNSIDANGQESLFYGYNRDDKPSPKRESEYTLELLSVSADAGNTILVTDYVSSKDKVDDSYSKNAARGFLSFAADTRELTSIPPYPDPVYSENSKDIRKIAEAENFLYLINFQEFETKESLISRLSETNYDLLILDFFFRKDQPLSKEDLVVLSKKKNGGERIVMAYMSIGEAEDYRYYWDFQWDSNPPEWLKEENPDWPGNYKVEYWHPDWQRIIFGTTNAYLDQILETGFDGIYLDIIDGFEYFESR